MKVEYEFKKNKLKYYDIANNALIMSEKLKKRPKRIHRYSSRVVIDSLLLILYAYIIYRFLPILFNVNINIDYLNYFIMFVICYDFMVFINLISLSNTVSDRGIIEIEENGIKNIQDDGSWEFLPYDAIEMIIITKETIIIKKSKLQFWLLPRKNNSKIIDEMKKYRDNLLIIKNNK